MTEQQKKRLEAAGWKFGSAADFLGLTPSEVALVEMKLALAQSVKLYRTRLGLSQVKLGRVIHSSQSRVAKMEAGDRSVTMDLILRTLLTLGASRPDLAKLISVRKVEDVRRVRIRPHLPSSAAKELRA